MAYATASFNIQGETMRKLIFLVILTVISTSLWAERSSRPVQTDTCIVIKVIDGDTFICQMVNRNKETIRLLGVDAPESGQAFGQQAKQVLNNLIIHKPVSLSYKYRDKYGRILAEVVYNKTDINLLMVQRGLAWAYNRKQKRSIYWCAEQAAKAQRIGLWQEANPLLPKQWRKLNKRK